MSQQASQQTAIPPPITVSVADFQKIEALLDMPAYRKLPGIAALQSELDRANVVGCRRHAGRRRWQCIRPVRSSMM